MGVVLLSLISCVRGVFGFFYDPSHLLGVAILLL